MLLWHRENDLRWTNALVAGCSGTLESLYHLQTAWYDRCASTSELVPYLLFVGDPRSAPIDLSKATRLKDIAFWPGGLTTQWITTALRIITSDHRDLQKIPLYIPYGCVTNPTGAILRQVIEELAYEQRLDLDRLLVEFWELRSIRPKITNGGMPRNDEKGVMSDCMGRLLPEITKGGIIDLDG